MGAPPFPVIPREAVWGRGGLGGKAAPPEGAAGCCSLPRGARNCGVRGPGGAWPGGAPAPGNRWSCFSGAPGLGRRRQRQPQEKEPGFTMAQSSPGRAAPAEPPAALKNPKIGCLRGEGSAGPRAALPSPAARRSLALPRRHRAQPGGGRLRAPPSQPKPRHDPSVRPLCSSGAAAAGQNRLPRRAWRAPG